jgi:NAD(P)-dependent dehydrogenase (short-subunit alcohol dehydrogenase family)
VAYAASKGAVASLTLPMTRDLARYGIRVVTIAPSLFDSRMTSMMSDKVRASLTRVMEFPCKLSPLLLHSWRGSREEHGRKVAGVLMMNSETGTTA